MGKKWGDYAAVVRVRVREVTAFEFARRAERTGRPAAALMREALEEALRHPLEVEARPYGTRDEGETVVSGGSTTDWEATARRYERDGGRALEVVKAEAQS